MNTLELNGETCITDKEEVNLSRRSFFSVVWATTLILSGCGGETESEKAERFKLEKEKRDIKTSELLAHFKSWSWVAFIWKWWELKCYHGKADSTIASPRNSNIYEDWIWTYWEKLYRVVMKKNGLTPDILKWSFSWEYSLHDHCKIVRKIKK